MLKNFLKKSSLVVLELAVIAGGLYYLAQKKGINTFSEVGPALERTIQDMRPETPFPILDGPVARTFDWKYKNTKYSLDETLHQSVYEYYQSKPKEYLYSGDLPANWEEEYYGMFLEGNENDKTISDLAAQINSLGEKHKLSADQIVELTLAFVQTIQYDDAKAKNILAANSDETVRFPYEILYEQQGVCSEKSLLAYLLLRQLGYGAALFVFPEENHMAVAVQCPQDYSNYSSGYCFAETTSIGNKIGVIPEMDMQNNKIAEIKQLSAYDVNQSEQVNLQKLGQATILLPTKGNQYLGIIQTEKIASQIDQLKKNMETLASQFQSQKKTIAEKEKTLKNWQDDLENYNDKNQIDKYNSLVKKYNELLSEYKKDVKKYNSSVALYNQAVQKYNALIKQ